MNRLSTSILVGLWGAVTMAAISWAKPGWWPSPHMIPAAFVGAAVAGAALPALLRPNRRFWWPLGAVLVTLLGSILAGWVVSLTETGFTLAEVLIFGPVLVADGIWTDPVVTVVWALGGLAVCLVAQYLGTNTAPN